MEPSGNIFIFLSIGLVTGAVVFWFIQRGRIAAATAQAKAEDQIELVRRDERLDAAQAEISRLSGDLAETESRLLALEQGLGGFRERVGAAEAANTGLLGQISILGNEKASLATARDSLSADATLLTNKVTELETTLAAERTKAEEKLQLLQNAEAQMTERFKLLAGEILEDKSKRFTEQNQTNLNQLLDPLKQKIEEFKGKVQEVYVQEGKDRSALAEQVKQLMSLNNQLSKDAHNLTNALKGQAKTQGNWGELILERVLVSSGLRKGFEYDVQESHVRADGTRAQPDVVTHLPEDRHLIIDAKMSLTAYEAYANADSDAVRETALKRHMESVRAHIKDLSDKNYQDLYGVKSLDFVLMFIPVEPAFMLAISHDSELWHDAWKKNVLLVSPSTLLFVLRTVAHLWRQEQQSRNAQEIAKRGAELYDKLAGFSDDLMSLGNKLDQAKKSYDSAMSKFSGGRGNVIRQAEMLKELGVKPTKQLPQSLIEESQGSSGEPGGG